LLAGDGWVSPARQGRQRRIQARLSKPVESGATDQLPVTLLSPYPVTHRVTLLEMEATQKRLAEVGRGLRFVAPDIFHLKRPERHLERLVGAHPSIAWILYGASEPVQRWFDKRGIPTFLYQLPFPDVKLPFVAQDWEAAAFHAGIQLLRRGHRVLGMLEYKERRPALLDIERGLTRALATVGLGRIVVFKDDLTPASVARSLQAAFNLRERPTALILARANQVLTCYTWLASLGIRVPADVSLVSLANDSWYAEIYPPLCYYEPNSRTISRKIAERVMELVATGKVLRQSVRVPKEYVEGATIGPAPLAKA
jgi:DNA-binding LacI/PurR family transcriptional regulator